MKRDSLKTVIGLAIIGGIVVATFLYGNAQRQAQLRRDQDVKNQQSKVAAASPTASATVKPQVSASIKPQSSVKPTSTPVTAVVDGAAKGPKVIPDTGSGVDGLIGLAAISMAGVLWRGSNARVRQALRVRS